MSHKIFRIVVAMLIAFAALSINVGAARANIGINCKDGKINVSLQDFTPYKNQFVKVYVNGQNVGSFTFDGAGNGNFSGNAPPCTTQI